jgi:hypothetical protein
MQVAPVWQPLSVQQGCPVPPQFRQVPWRQTVPEPQVLFAQQFRPAVPHSIQVLVAV